MVDNLTPAQRSFTMSRIRSRDTRPELAIQRVVHRSGLRYRKHVNSLPGRPDLAFTKLKIAVFIDGDFWHGWRFQLWKSKLSPYWVAKIEGNRRRDAKNFLLLREAGWRVIRIWEHEVKADPEACLARITRAVLLISSSSRSGL